MKKSTLLLMVVLLAACSVKSVQAPQAQADPREQELRQVIADAEPLARNILISLTGGNYAGYSRDFDERLRATVTEEAFRKLYEVDCQKKIGAYEPGKCQINKIEKHPDCYAIYYFVKFRNVSARDPVVMVMNVVRAREGLKVSGLDYRHALLGR